jgi:FlgD Ig-like domain/Bacterial Ig domain/Putative Ig domain
MRPGRSRLAALALLLFGFALHSAPVSAQSFCDFAPRVSTAGTRAAVGVQAVVEVTVVDPNGDGILSLTADTSALPAGNNAAFTTNASNTAGTLTWTPQVGQTGSYAVSFTASNALSGTASATLSVIDTGGAPFVQCPFTATTGEFRPLTFHVAAGDPDGEPIVSLTAAPLPAGATFTVNATNTAGTFDWTPNFTQAGSYNIGFTATSSSSATYNTAITVSQVDRAPVVFVPPSASGVAGSLLTVCVGAADPDGDAITGLTATPLPAGATFTSSPSNQAGTFSWVPTVNQTGTYNITFFAANALSGSATVPITISGTGDAPPVVTAPAAQTVTIGSTLAFNVTASDPNGDPISSLTASNLPPGASLVPNLNNTVGAFSWTPTAGQGGTYFVQFLATSNMLTSVATTAISVTGEELAARVFTTGGNGAIRLGSGKASWCANVEPVGGDFSVADVVPTSIVLISPGTGTVSQIAAIAGKGITSGDADRNTIADFEVCFSKDDLRQLFSLVSGRASETVAIRGDLASGSRFQGTLTVDVVGQGGPNGVAVLPNPPNPGAAIRFTTSRPGAIRARVFDIRGRLVRTMESSGEAFAGTHALDFDGRGDSGKPLPSGIYLFRVETPDGAWTTKAAILR